MSLLIKDMNLPIPKGLGGNGWVVSYPCWIQIPVDKNKRLPSLIIGDKNYIIQEVREDEKSD